MDASSCPGCRERDQRIATLEKRVQELEAQVRQLLGRNSSNSSMPPSANPPNAPKPAPKQRSGRKPGAQPGHSAQNRVRLPPEQVSQFEHFVPTTCACCQLPLPAEAGPNDPPPLWHQVVELPKVLAHVTEYQGHARICPGCGHCTQAVIPAEIRAHAHGPRLTAAVSCCTGEYHVSKRDARDLLQTVLGVSMAVGSVVACEQETSAATAAAHEEARLASAQVVAANLDETSWKLGKKMIWLWTVVSSVCTFYLVHAKRGGVALAAIFRKAFAGVMITDRWVAYDRQPLGRRQLCWAHLIRNFQACYDRGGAAKKIGEQLLCLADDVFTFWYQVRDGTLQRSTFRGYLGTLRPWLREVLAEGLVCGCAKTRALCKHVLKREKALWTFARVEGVEPTNNAAERALRRAVLWRKRSFGCKSEAGCRYVERMLTVVKTLQQQDRPVLDYLAEAIAAYRAGQPAPKLLPA
jgi:transposase